MLHFVETETRGMDEAILLYISHANKPVYVVEMLTVHILPSFANGGDSHCLEVQAGTLWVVTNCDSVNVVVRVYTRL
jgi:hypothetical protein